MATAKQFTVIQNLDIEKGSCGSRQFAEPTQEMLCMTLELQTFRKRKTKMKKLLFLVIALLLGGTAYAQENPRWELSADYSFARWNPSQGTVLNLHSLNGGGGSLVYNLTGFLGIKADLQGYGSQSNTFVLRTGSPLLPAGGSFNANGSLFTYNLGPVVKLLPLKAQPRFQTLFGGAHSNVYRTLYSNPTVLTTPKAPTTAPFARV